MRLTSTSGFMMIFGLVAFADPGMASGPEKQGGDVEVRTLQSVCAGYSDGL